MDGNQRMNILSRTSATVVGNDWTKLVTRSAGSNGVRITNNDASLSLALTYVYVGDTAPTVGATPVASKAEDYLPPKSTITLQIAPSVEVYGANTSGSSSTSSYVAREFV